MNNTNREEQLNNICNGIAESIVEMSDEAVEEEFSDVDAEKVRAVLTKGVNQTYLDARYKHEILQVQELGEQIGYGNMMSIASALWAISLKEKYGITSGAFLPTIGGFMKKREAEKAEKELAAKMERFQRMGIGA